jgi:hypothetical protein
MVRKSHEGRASQAGSSQFSARGMSTQDERRVRLGKLLAFSLAFSKIAQKYMNKFNLVRV